MITVDRHKVTMRLPDVVLVVHATADGFVRVRCGPHRRFATSRAELLGMLDTRGEPAVWRSDPEDLAPLAVEPAGRITGAHL